VGVKYRVDRASKLVRGCAYGVLTNEDLRDQYAHMMADETLRSDYRQLVDMREVTEVQVDEKEMRAAARTHVFDAGVRRAFVASCDAAYRYANMFATYAYDAGQYIRVFRDIGDAERWLEIGPTPIDPN
jgi:hypothetical protein